MSTQTGHFGIRFGKNQKEMESFIDKRLKKKSMNRKQYFVYLLSLDGYTVRPEDV